MILADIGFTLLGIAKAETKGETAAYLDRAGRWLLEQRVSHAALMEACEAAARSTHHPTCTFNKKNFDCQCHVGKAKAALKMAKNCWGLYRAVLRKVGE